MTTRPTDHPPTDVWAEIDLAAVSHNIREIKGILTPRTRLLAVVKANAYGHGLMEVAETALASGASALGVARVHEAIRLREGGCDAPVLIFGYTAPNMAEKLLDYDLTQSIWSLETAEALSGIARARKSAIKAHLNIDTGMGRLGILPRDPRCGHTNGPISPEAIGLAEAICRLPGLSMEGVYTHFATADEADKSLTMRQFQLFGLFLEQLEKRGIAFSLRHAANSAAIIDLPETHLDMARAGIAIYGYYPSRWVNTGKIHLRPALALKSRVIHLKKVNTGFKVSYGGVEAASRPTVIATVSVGYADGYRRDFSSRGMMMIKGYPAKVMGRVCMDQTMLDAGDVPEIHVGDEVSVMGSVNPASPIHMDVLSAQLGAITYELLTGISHRVPRYYRR